MILPKECPALIICKLQSRVKIVSNLPTISRCCSQYLGITIVGLYRDAMVIWKKPCYAHLHAYVVIELKTQTFHPSFLGQLSFYVSAINHQFKTEIDNPTIGLLICKDKDNVVAKYALESYKEPIGISEYQLSQLFPKDFKSSMPTIEELEKELKGK